MHILLILMMGLLAGILAGMLGIGGGVILVPSMVYLLHYDQHLAQGTSLFILLLPLGLGGLRQYWKDRSVDVRAGIICATGFLLGGYLGAKIAVPMASDILKACFGGFLIFSAIMLWRKSTRKSKDEVAREKAPRTTLVRAAAILLTSGACGVGAGMVGISGGVLLVPLLGLLFGFSQHRAQGTSLLALLPPTGLLAFLTYWKAGYVNWHTGVLLIPGVFMGGIVGGILASRLNPSRMRQVFAVMMFVLGAWQIFSARYH